MFGTIIAVFDGYSRSLQRTTALLFSKNENNEKNNFRLVYRVFLFVVTICFLVVVFQFGNNLKALVDFATVLSFVVAPIIAIFNFRLVTGKFLDKIAQPSMGLKILSYAGILFLIGFAIVFLITRIWA